MRERERGLKDGSDTDLVFVQCGVHDARWAIGELADVAAKKDGLAGFDHLKYAAERFSWFLS